MHHWQPLCSRFIAAGQCCKSDVRIGQSDSLRFSDIQIYSVKFVEYLIGITPFFPVALVLGSKVTYILIAPKSIGVLADNLALAGSQPLLI